MALKRRIEMGDVAKKPRTTAGACTGSRDSGHNAGVITRKHLLWLLVPMLVAGVAIPAIWVLGRHETHGASPAGTSVAVLRSTPDVLVAIRALARLETVSYHLERIIDLSDKQSRVFGLVESEDALLLVAAANITAGVDLQKLLPSAIEVDWANRRAKVRLPASEILSSALDGSRTYVHTRRTGLLARRKEDLETRARAEAERALLEAALKAGILEAASTNAARSVEALLRSLGFSHVEVVASRAPVDLPRSD